MKKLLLILLLITIPLMGAENVTASNEPISGLEMEPVVLTSICIVKLNTAKSWRSHMRFLESTDNYNRVHPSGAMGAYGFMDYTLLELGINITREQFEADPSVFTPDLQELAIERNCKKNERILREEIRAYAGQTISGVLITKSGIIAAAHLGGAGAVRKFFASGYVAEDTNGTSVLDYMKEFETIKYN